jgi:Flp pilus assembly protein TadD
MRTLGEVLDIGWRRHLEGDARTAEQWYRSAIGMKPSHQDAWCLLGMACHDQGRYDEAVAAYNRALMIDPNFPIALSNLGNTLTTQRKPSEGVARCREAIRLDPAFSTAHTNLAVALLALGHVDEATRSFQRAVELTPDDAALQANLGAALTRQGKFDQALSHAERALSLDPEEVEAHLIRAAVWLRRGDLARGWKEYEWRWKSRPYQVPRYSNRHLDSIWDGSSLRGCSLLVWGEQGVGDEIMFAQMYRDIIPQPRRIILECDERLVPLFARSFPAAEVVARPPAPVPRDWMDEFDIHCPAGSLAQHLRTNVSLFPSVSGYLVADPDLVGVLRRRYDRLGTGIKIGISWRSKNVSSEIDRRRSISLDQWGAVLDMKDIVWMSLQYGDCTAELEDVRKRLGVAIHCDSSVNPLLDLDAFAAQVSAMDLVISIDNSTVHMAGSLGVAVWTLLPCVPDSRWMEGRADSPWYPSMRLFRRSRADDWHDVFDRVGAAVCRMLAAQRDRAVGSGNTRR